MPEPGLCQQLAELAQEDGWNIVDVNDETFQAENLMGTVISVNVDGGVATAVGLRQDEDSGEIGHPLEFNFLTSLPEEFIKAYRSW